jgi:hypothetical protein
LRRSLCHSLYWVPASRFHEDKLRGTDILHGYCGEQHTRCRSDALIGKPEESFVEHGQTGIYHIGIVQQAFVADDLLQGPVNA